MIPVGVPVDTTDAPMDTTGHTTVDAPVDTTRCPDAVGTAKGCINDFIDDSAVIAADRGELF